MKRYPLLYIITISLYLSSYIIGMEQSAKKYVSGLGFLNGIYDTYSLKSNVLYQVDKVVEETKNNQQPSFDIHHPDNQGRFAKVLKELINEEDETKINILLQGLNFLNRPIENSGRMQEVYDFARAKQRCHEQKTFELITKQDHIFVDEFSKQLENTKSIITKAVNKLTLLLQTRETELKKELEKNQEIINISKNIRTNTLVLNKKVKENTIKESKENNEYNSDTDEGKPDQYDMNTILKRTELCLIVNNRQKNIEELKRILLNELTHWENLPIYNSNDRTLPYSLNNSTRN